MLAFFARMVWRVWSASTARAERDAFAALQRACASTDAAAAYGAFARWRRFLDPARDTAAAAIQTPLDAALFTGAPSTWDAERSSAFLESAATLRRRHRSSTTHAEALPPLNP